MGSFDPRGVLIDGSLPRTDATRVADLLGDAKTLLDEFSNDDTFSWAIRWRQYYNLLSEKYTYDENSEHWHGLEDEVIELINTILPEQYVCMLVPDDPGTVVIEDRSDDEN